MNSKKQTFKNGRKVLEYYIPNYQHPQDVSKTHLFFHNDTEETAQSVAQNIVKKLSKRLSKIDASNDQ